MQNMYKIMLFLWKYIRQNCTFTEGFWSIPCLNWGKIIINISTEHQYWGVSSSLLLQNTRIGGTSLSLSLQNTSIGKASLLSSLQNTSIWRESSLLHSTTIYRSTTTTTILGCDSFELNLVFCNFWRTDRPKDRQTDLGIKAPSRSLKNQTNQRKPRAPIK